MADFDKTPVQEVLIEFDKKNFSKVKEFLDAQTNRNTTIPLDANDNPNAISENERYSVLNDIGGGTVSQGLRALELLTKLVRGVNPAGLFMFEDPISITPEQIRKSDTQTSRNLVISQLGMTEFIIPALSKAPSVVEEYYSLMDIIIKRIRNGTFKAIDFNTTTTYQSKQVAKAAGSYKQVI